MLHKHKLVLSKVFQSYNSLNVFFRLLSEFVIEVVWNAISEKSLKGKLDNAVQ